MSTEFVIKKRVRRRRLRGSVAPESSLPKPSPSTPPKPTPSSISQPPPQPPQPPPPPPPPSEEPLPEYLMRPPKSPSEVTLEPPHTPELVNAFRVASEILKSSFRPAESNLATGKIRLEST